MKAAEVMRLYEAGKRDFSGESLKGQNFKGKDLSGADFSGADIRGTNFTNANLTGANLTQAKAGLQRRWSVGLTIAAFVTSSIAGLFAAFVGFLVMQALDSVNPTDQSAGLVVLIVLILFLVATLAQGIVTGAFVAVSVGSLVGALTSLIAVVSSGAVSEAGSLLGNSVGVVIGAIAIGIAATGLGGGAIAGAGMVAGLRSGIFAFLGTAFIALASVDAGVSEAAGAGISALLGAYIGWRALLGDKKHNRIQTIAIAFAAIGGTSFRGATLTDADFSQALLKSSDLRRSVLLRTRWRDALKLDCVRPGETYLNNPNVRELVLTGNGQEQSYDHLLNLAGINLQGANLVKADFTGSILKDSNLQGADLTNASLIGANLNWTNLQDVDLSGSKLVQTQLDEADLTGSILTGAYIEDWNITTQTKLRGIRCDYVYMRLPPEGHLDRAPHRKPDDRTKEFTAGEFVDFITPMVETLDLYHNQTVDPRAVAIAFSDLRQQNPEADLEIISMEKRGQNLDKFNLRVRTNPQADLSQLHQQYFQQYEHLLTLPPQALVALLMEKESNSQKLARLLETAINQPKTQINKTYQGDNTVSEPGNINTNQTFNAPVGNAAGTNTGTMSAIQNIYGPNTEDITRLLTTLRDQAQTFPTDQKDEAIDILETLEDTLAKPEPDKQRIARWLKKLVALSAVIGTLASGAAAVSGDVSTFTTNILDLTEKLGIPIEHVQLPPTNTP